jgi:glycosyltransferase involved in cell wall biosynthesis
LVHAELAVITKEGRLTITIAICTWNRANLLERTLARLRELIIPQGVNREVLIVDNNSSDETAVVVARAAEGLSIRYVFEPRSGISHARNRAVREAEGTYILWTDDDVLVSRTWLAEYWRAFSRFPDAALFGGPIVPWYAVEPPTWVSPSLEVAGGHFAVLRIPDDAGPIEDHPLPFGANMAARREAHEAHPFDTRLGARPGLRLVGEETAFIRKVLQAGGSGRWVPDARVQHYIPEHRMTLRFMRQYYYGTGATIARMNETNRKRGWAGRPLWLWRQAIENECKYQVRRFTSGPEMCISNLILASTAWGQLVHYSRGQS